MTRVDFYVISRGGENARLLTACRISDKAWRQGYKVLVRAADEKQAESVDSLLWTFKDDSFVPHERWQAGQAVEAPILIACNAYPPSFADVLVNLGHDHPSESACPARVTEIVDASQEGRAKGRDRFRHYRNLGFELHTHEL